MMIARNEMEREKKIRKVPAESVSYLMKLDTRDGSEQKQK